MKITQGAKTAKCRAMVYAQAGIGKSYLGSKFKGALFIDTEGSCAYLGVARTEENHLTRYAQFQSNVRDLVMNKDTYTKQFKTIVIDTVDGLVSLAVAQVKGADEPGITSADRSRILAQPLADTNGGYGRGNARLVDFIHDETIAYLDCLITAGYNVVLLTHATSKDVRDGEGLVSEMVAPRTSVAASIDRKIADQFIDWCDAVYFLKKRADGSRAVLTESDVNALAKNRLGLSGEIELNDGFDYERLITFMPNETDAKEKKKHGNESEA